MCGTSCSSASQTSNDSESGEPSPGLAHADVQLGEERLVRVVRGGGLGLRDLDGPRPLRHR